MKTQLLLVLPLALCLSEGHDEIAFRPAAESEVAKKLEIHLDARVTDMHVTFNGEELPPDAMGEFASEPLVARVLVGVTEKYVASKDGHPTDLLRTYEEMSLSAESGEDSEKAGDFAKLQGKTVRFKRNDDGDGYDKSFHESDGDSALLDDLWDDMDLRVLLPDHKVSAGDTWEVAGPKLGPLFIPGGMPGSSDAKEDDGFAHFMQSIGSQLGGAMSDFNVKCKYKGERESDGVKVREIAFTFDGKATLDVSQMLSEVIASQEEAPEANVDAKAEIGLKGEGLLLWDPAAGRMQGFTMSSDATVGLKMDVDMKADGESFAIAMSANAEGKLGWELAATKK